MLALFLCAALAASGAILQVDRPRHSFGEIPPGAPVKATFQVTNAGDGVLHILRVLPSCECTTASVDKPFLTAGDSATLTMVFDPVKDKGHLERSIRVITDAAGTRTADLLYDADVVFPVMATEEAVFFPGTLPHDVLTREVGVRSTVAGDLDLALASPAPPFLRVAITGGKRDARVAITLDGALLPRQGASNGKLVFTTGIPELPQLPLEYFAYPGHAVEAQPEGLAFDPARAGRAQSYTVELVEARNRPFRVSLAQVPAPFRARLLTAGSAPRHRLKVSLGAGVKTGRHEGVLVLKVDDPDQETVDIKVTADFTPNPAGTP